MALLSLDCSGGRSGGRDGRERVGVALESWLKLFCEFSKMLLLERLTEPRSATRILPVAVPNAGLIRSRTKSTSKPPSLNCIDIAMRTELKERNTQGNDRFSRHFFSSLKANSFVYLPCYDRARLVSIPCGVLIECGLVSCHTTAAFDEIHAITLSDHTDGLVCSHTSLSGDKRVIYRGILPCRVESKREGGP